MRLQVIYTIEKKVEVQIEVSDTKIIKAFEENGGINSDSDFKGNSDKRWDATNPVNNFFVWYFVFIR